MSLKVPDASALRLLDSETTGWGSGLVLHLFKNNHTPAAGDTVADYTEANFTGYASQAITGWGSSSTVSGRAVANAATKTFTVGTVGTGNDIYGYYVTDGSGNLLWAEKDANAPVNMNVTGYTYAVTPSFSRKSEF